MYLHLIEDPVDDISNKLLKWPTIFIIGDGKVEDFLYSPKTEIKKYIPELDLRNTQYPFDTIRDYVNEKGYIFAYGTENGVWTSYLTSELIKNKLFPNEDWIDGYGSFRYSLSGQDFIVLNTYGEEDYYAYRTFYTICAVSNTKVYLGDLVLNSLRSWYLENKTIISLPSELQNHLEVFGGKRGFYTYRDKNYLMLHVDNSFWDTLPTSLKVNEELSVGERLGRIYIPFTFSKIETISNSISYTFSEDKYFDSEAQFVTKISKTSTGV